MFFHQKYATRISVCVIAVIKSQDFLLKVRRLFYFFDDDAYAFTSTRRNFLDDDARDSTSTTSLCFFDDVGHYVECYKSNDSFDKVERCFDIVAGVDGAKLAFESRCKDSNVDFLWITMQSTRK